MESLADPGIAALQSSLYLGGALHDQPQEERTCGKQIVLGAGGLALGVGLVAACDDDGSASPNAATVTYVSNMSAANEIPPSVGSNGTGTATYLLNARTISYTVDVNNLSDTAIASHIHAGDSQTNGAIIVPFIAAHVRTGQVASGTINLDQPIVSGSSSITGDSLLALFNSGDAYTNVHTPTFPNGEVRGQIISSEFQRRAAQRREAQYTSVDQRCPDPVSEGFCPTLRNFQSGSCHPVRHGSTAVAAVLTENFRAAVALLKVNEAADSAIVTASVGSTDGDTKPAFPSV